MGCLRCGPSRARLPPGRGAWGPLISSWVANSTGPGSVGASGSGDGRLLTGYEKKCVGAIFRWPPKVPWMVALEIEPPPDPLTCVNRMSMPSWSASSQVGGVLAPVCWRRFVIVHGGGIGWLCRQGGRTGVRFIRTGVRLRGCCPCVHVCWWMVGFGLGDSAARRWPCSGDQGHRHCVTIAAMRQAAGVPRRRSV